MIFQNLVYNTAFWLNFEQQFLMGSQNSKFLSQQELPHEFRPIKQLPGVFESILSGVRLQRHKVNLNSKTQISYQKQIFVFRRMNSDRVMSAHFFQKFIPNHFCNMSYQVCFFTEYPSYVLSLDLVIPMERGLHLLIESLKGFELLFTRFGPFSVGFQNIFFDSCHQLKVWISSDLGKTRIENKKEPVNQQKMIMDVFRIYDQLRDERNSQITFSNYLRRFKQKQCSILTFKNIIIYMVDEASKYFVTRVKSKQLQFLDKKQHQISQNFRSNLAKNSNKQNCTNIISLKTRNRNKSKNPSTAGTSTNCQAIFNQSCNLNEFRNQSNIDKDKKSKRHNSQQDYHQSREIKFYKENQLNVLQPGQREPVNRNSQNALIFFQGNKYFPSSPSNTIRLSRRSLDQLDKPTNEPRTHEDKTKRTCIKKVNKLEIARPKHFDSIVQTQIVKEDGKTLNRINITPCQGPPRGQFQRKVIFGKSERGFDEKIDRNKMMTGRGQDENEKYMILSNLQTIKSIINSDYSDIDSQIRNDLQNLDI